MVRYRHIELERRGLDEKARTVPATLSSDAPVERGFGMEVLAHTAEAIDLTRARPSLPLLFAHDHKQPIGAVENVRLSGNSLQGTLRFSRGAKGEEIFQDVVDNLIRGVSIGYAIDEMEDLPDGGIRATKWRLFEASVLSIQADTNSQIHRGREMTQETKKTPEQEILTREQERRREIREAYTLFANRDGFRDLMDRCLDDVNVKPEQARQLLLKKLGEGATPLNDQKAIIEYGNYGYATSPGNEHRTISGGVDRLPEFRSAAVDSLLMRNNITVKEPHPAARDLGRMSVVTMAETMLRQYGIATSSMNPTEIISRAFTHSTSDFPSLLANVANKALMQGFEDEPASHRQWVRVVDVNDFKAQSRVKLSDAPQLLEVTENGEITHGTMNERASSYQLATYARLIGISRQAIINDDLQALTAIPRAFGQAGRRLEADKVYKLITDNITMSDGTALFHANHGNLAATGSALTAASLGAAKAAMRKQKAGQGGILNIVPRYLIVPASLEIIAEVLVASTMLRGEANNVENLGWIRNLEIVVEPRLDANSETAWYLAASAAQADTVETAYLNGQRGVFVDQEQGFDILGAKFRAVLDFAAAAIDWTGLYRNPGA